MLNKKWREHFKIQFLSSWKNKFLWRPNALLSNRNFCLKIWKKQTGKEDWVLIINVCIKKANTTKEKIDVMSNMFVILDEFGKNSRKYLLLASDFNLFFGWKLDVQGRNPSLKKNHSAKPFDNYDLCDICSIRNAKSSRFTFTKKHSLGFIQCRLDILWKHFKKL